jgi:hypothetical protein
MLKFGITLRGVIDNKEFHPPIIRADVMQPDVRKGPPDSLGIAEIRHSDCEQRVHGVL